LRAASKTTISMNDSENCFPFIVRWISIYFINEDKTWASWSLPFSEALKSIRT